MRRTVSLFAMEKPKYLICEQQYSVPDYLISYGLALGKVREVRKNIKKIIADIDENITKPSGNHLSVEKEKIVLKTLTDKYPYWDALSISKPLVILNINNSHKLYNSICGVNDDATSFVIYMFNMKDNSTAPEYVFLHELGHALQVALTGSDLLVPDEFIAFNKLLNKSFELTQGSYELAEVFADTFAISIMHDTDLSEFDPFDFPKKLNNAFAEFFTELFDTYK